MNCMVRTTIRAAVAVLAMTASAAALAQVTFARGDAVWNDTTNAVPGSMSCLGCHLANTAQLGTIRIRYASLTQVEVRTRIDQAFAGTTGLGTPTTMNGVYPGTTINDNDRNALAIFFGNFVPAATVGASTPLASLTAAAVGQTAQSTLTITNNGANALVISNIAFSGADAAQFSRVNTGSPCVATIMVAASCQELIRFTPTSTGTKTATLTISHDRNPLGTTLSVSGSSNAGTPPPTGGGLPTGGSGGGGGAVWPWALLLMAAAALRRRRLH